MAKKVTKASIRKTAAKAARGSISKATEAQAIYGDEPKPVKPDSSEYESYLRKYYNWANGVFESTDLKEHFMNYCKSKKIDASACSSLHPSFFNIGKTAYLVNSGKEVPTRLIEKLSSEVDYLIKLAKRKTKEEEIIAAAVEPERKSPKHLEEYWNIYSSIDSLIETDKVSDKEIIGIFNKNQPSIKSAKLIQEHYLEDYLIWKSDKGDRAYNKIVKKNLGQYEIICNQINAFVVNLENTKSAVRKKPRAKKAKPALKLVEKLPYMKADPKMGITSIPPESIIGSSMVLIFNTKTRKFGILKSLPNSGGLSAKGATITNIDENLSVCKTIRKPEEQLSKLTGSTSIRAEKLFKEIKAVETKQKGRMSADVLILKVYK